jgi:hypothetical protein
MPQDHPGKFGAIERYPVFVEESFPLSQVERVAVDEDTVHVKNDGGGKNSCLGHRSSKGVEILL